MASAPRTAKDLAQELIDNVVRIVFLVSLAATLICVGLLVFNVIRLGETQGAGTADALKNIQLFDKVLPVAVIALAISGAVAFWGSEFLAVGLIALAGGMYFAPLFLAGKVQGGGKAAEAAILALQSGGLITGVIAGIVTLFDVATRVRERATRGAKADLAKYGRGVKEDPDRQNVFMGKCWQLPYCRRYVRERCPIFYAKRACWRERVGCMCEEKIIAGAMSEKGIVIPKDAVAAAKYIPHNHRLTNAQKAERCRNCVIYNQHQRHKYQLGVPLIIAFVVAVYVLAHGPLITMVKNAVISLDKVINTATLGASGRNDLPAYVPEALLAVLMFGVLSYLLRALEFAVFRLKI